MPQKRDDPALKIGIFERKRKDSVNGQQTEEKISLQYFSVSEIRSEITKNC